MGVKEALMVLAGRRSLAVAATILSLAAAAGCAARAGGSLTSAGGSPQSAAAQATRPQAPAAAPSASVSPTPSVPAGVNVAAFDALARREATAWARSPLAKEWQTGLVVFIPDELTSGPSTGFPSLAAKEAFGNGDLVFTGPPPSSAPAGIVTWPDGSSIKVPVLSEPAAFGKLTSSRQCPSCVTTPLSVTAVRPTTLAVATSRGRAQVPAWAFTIEGVSAPVIQAALPPGSYVIPGSQDTPSRNALGRLGAEFVGAFAPIISADGRALTLRLPGGFCDTTWGALDDEVGGAVVVGGWMHNPHPHGGCLAVLVMRTATVALSVPLAGRVIIDAATGQPVRLEPLTPAPGRS
ncbi:hypothetical protein EAS64_40450 [Trebonia kvetii]|uniref:Uncharacterized protein n=1 Tax=Trebonia kvetii TaxID=2480626 RepID=A0A6P2BLG7_9ACTN|nr:hypothetical protein [Trebonia kvetii]TVY99908.1 hypothetical protein EAS64_40450 [Trebonia kvetii]